MICHDTGDGLFGDALDVKTWSTAGDALMVLPTSKLPVMAFLGRASLRRPSCSTPPALKACAVPTRSCREKRLVQRRTRSPLVVLVSPVRSKGEVSLGLLLSLLRQSGDSFFVVSALAEVVVAVDSSPNRSEMDPRT
jgi:hypothetical protein